MRKNKFQSLRNSFSAKPDFIPSGVIPQKGNQKGIATFQFPSHNTHKTSRISSNLRIWQSYSRVLQILKVLCAWYSWKYVARIGSNTRAVLFISPQWGPIQCPAHFAARLLRWASRPRGRACLPRQNCPDTGDTKRAAVAGAEVFFWLGYPCKLAKG